MGLEKEQGHPLTALVERSGGSERFKWYVLLSTAQSYSSAEVHKTQSMFYVLRAVDHTIECHFRFAGPVVIQRLSLLPTTGLPLIHRS